MMLETETVEIKMKVKYISRGELTLDSRALSACLRKVCNSVAEVFAVHARHKRNAAC